MTAAIILAAGDGARLGGRSPKGIRSLANRLLFEHSLAATQECNAIDRVVVVVPPALQNGLVTSLEWERYSKLESLVPGGQTRMESVVAGIQAFESLPEWLAVHDAARPLATASLFADVIDAARQHGGAIAAARVTDTLKHAEGNRVVTTMDRSDMWQAQTPQVFRTDMLQAALAECLRLGIEATDDAQAIEYAGHAIQIVENTRPNPKITTPADWKYVEHLLATDA